MEEWKDIPTYPNYLASNDGRIMRRTTGRILKLSLSNSGYHFVSPSNNGCAKPASVHRLVAYAFFGLPQAWLDVNHKNGDKLDNHVQNLEYVTRSENIAHAHKIGTRKHTSLRADRGVKNTKLTESKVRDIKQRVSCGERQRVLADEYGVSQAVISAIVRGKWWKWVVL
ncbi:MAG: hypothetical protein QG592_1493 [Pseudomonadota bacterium]|nr:hypothetical protein [Pseudomonadota bacterium]